MQAIITWLRRIYNKSVHSIGYYPALIAVLGLLLFIFMYNYEVSGGFDFLKRRNIWLTLKNTEAARTIVSTITTGVISLTVFSFSMVMVVMSQAASQISNRILDNFIGGRFQQATLGFYIATILGSFFLLTVIDDRGVSAIPSITVFLLVALTIVDIFLFVSFLHYITQSVRYEQLIKRIHKQTEKSLKNAFLAKRSYEWSIPKLHRIDMASPVSDYFQGVDKNRLLRFAVEHNIYLEFHALSCSFLLKGQPLFSIYAEKEVTDKALDEMFEMIDFYSGQEIDKNAFYGFLHLSEVAVKALSPGINDPGTAVLSIHALTDLLSHVIPHQPSCGFKDTDGITRICLREKPFEEIFMDCIYPIWDYGKKDRFVTKALKQMLDQLRFVDKNNYHKAVLDEFETIMKG